MSPPKVFSPLEAEVAELRSRLDAIEGRDRPPASPVVAPAAPTAPPAAKAALEKRLRGAPAAPRGITFGNAAARAPGTPPKDEAARERRSVFAKASPGAPAKEAPSPFLEYHNKKSISPGAPAAPEAVPEKPRQRPPPRPPSRTPRRRWIRTRRGPSCAPRSASYAPRRGGGRGLGRRLGAGPRALRRGRRDAAVPPERRAR